jgi:thioredoxin 1
MKSIVILLAGIFLSAAVAKAQTPLSADEFQQKIQSTKNGQLVDVRTPGEYKKGHLKQAKNIDYKNPAFTEQIKSLDKNKPVFVYCLGGVRSAAAAEILHQNGFKEIYDMKGGYVKWTADGKPVDEPKGAETAGMTSVDFKRLITSKDVVLIDFYAPWCAPCVKMLPTIHKLTTEYASKAKIETISYDDNKALAKELGISEIPAFLIYKNGKLMERKNGFLEESEFRQMIDSKL